MLLNCPPGHADVLVRELPHLRRQQLRDDRGDPALVARAPGAGAQQTTNLQPIVTNDRLMLNYYDLLNYR